MMMEDDKTWNVWFNLSQISVMSVHLSEQQGVMDNFEIIFQISPYKNVVKTPQNYIIKGQSNQYPQHMILSKTEEIITETD